MVNKYPQYLNLLESGELAKRSKKLKEVYKSCTLCPWDCKIDRTAGQIGICRSRDIVKVSSATPHFGEEPMISGKKGSGTIFFSYCNMRCNFCQNYQISQKGLGNEISDADLAGLMLSLQKKGCHNINLVSPTHYLPNIISALVVAAGKGLNIPLVYNTNGYEKVETLKILDGIVDIYLPDIKYSDNETAKRLSNAPNYVDFNRKSLKEMYRQVGDLELDNKKIAIKGLIIRHLVLPNDFAGSKGSLQFIADELSKDVYVGIMSQYMPCHKAVGDQDLGRKITPDEYRRVVKWAKEACLHHILTQELDSSEVYLPDFEKEDPFN